MMSDFVPSRASRSPLTTFTRDSSNIRSISSLCLTPSASLVVLLPHRMFTVTWNVNSKSPSFKIDLLLQLDMFADTNDMPDIYVFG
jgi:hypothetical protein